MILQGGCHCGNLRVAFTTALALDDLPLRACACSFCRAHGAVTASDPRGSLEISAADWGKVSAYRFSLRTADFLVCRDCGVYLAAVIKGPRGAMATLNVNALADRARFTATPQPMNYDGETAEARAIRRAARFTPAIVHRP